MSEPWSATSDSLNCSLQRFGLRLETPAVEQRLEAYCRILWRQNQTLNLTRHLDYDTFVARDLNDAQQLSGLLLPSERVLDIGSGGGVPGMLLAILRPDLQLTLCESVAKKARALEAMMSELKLEGRLCHQRAESLLDRESFDACVARAVGPLWKICDWFQGHWKAIGRLLALKGARWKDELAEAQRHPSFAQVDYSLALEYPMLGTDSHSYILKLWAKGAPEPGKMTSGKEIT